MLFKNINTFFATDARHFQIVWLSLFLLAGTSVLDWHISLLHVGLVIGVSLLTQMVLAFVFDVSQKGWKSALITALGLSLILRFNLPITAALAALLAISSKFFIRSGNKHIFNPANLGIVAVVLLTGDAWVSPGQWGSHAILLFLLGAMGFLVVRKVDRIDTMLTFFLVYGSLLLIRNVWYLGWPIDYVTHQVTSGTLMLFTCFMITDPKTTPNHRLMRILWTAMVAAIAFGLSNFGFVYSAPIWALCIASPSVVLFDKLRKAAVFTWQNPQTISQTS